MGAGEGVSAARGSLIGREADAIVESLARSHPRELTDNPDGIALLGDAVRDAIRLGLDAGCEHAGRAVGELDFSHAEAWALWQRQRDRTPEARAWPAELAVTEPRVVAHARELVEGAGRDLGLHGRSARALGDVGEQAAEAGAALTESSVPDSPRTATAAPVGDVQPDGSVRVAVAANQAEAELLTGSRRHPGRRRARPLDRGADARSDCSGRDPRGRRGDPRVERAGRPELALRPAPEAEPAPRRAPAARGAPATGSLAPPRSARRSHSPAGRPARGRRGAALSGRRTPGRRACRRPGRTRRTSCTCGFGRRGARRARAVRSPDRRFRAESSQ